jgi:C-terminal processing protease CtpA/Prc
LKAGPVVFDLRDEPRAADLLPSNLPLSRTSGDPVFRYRLHAGYQPPAASGSGGYQSYWMSAPSLHVDAAANPIRPVFLVNRASAIPLIALAAQASGAGAIVSEEALSDAQLPTYVQVPFAAGRVARVRNRELLYPDGTTGVAANLVVAAGDTALQRAVEIARTGQWPEPAGRPRIAPPSPYIAEAIYDVPFPETGIRMLAAARIWAVYHYFHPYLSLYDDDWDAVLVRYLERLEKAAGARDYHLGVAEMVALTRDSHCSVTSSAITSYFGTTIPFVEVRWIEKKVVVTRVLAAALQSLIRPGDVVRGIDGQSVQQRLDDLTPYLAASTPQSLMNKAMLYFLAGGFGSVAHLDLEAPDGSVRTVSATRTNGIYNIQPYRTGAVYRLLDARVGYVDLERLTNNDVNAMFELFRNTDAIVMDMRGYPQGTAWSIAPRLTDAVSPIAALFRRNMVSGIPVDGEFVWSYRFEQSLPATSLWRYHGKTVMLTDARAISQSEHSGLFYRSANGTKFIGSGTTGANGDVTYFYAPGNILIYFTGHDVRWPDGSPLQRVGLTPDIYVEPTIRGVADGRDEVLERALEYLRTGR